MGKGCEKVTGPGNGVREKVRPDKIMYTRTIKALEDCLK